MSSAVCPDSVPVVEVISGSDEVQTNLPLSNPSNDILNFEDIFNSQ